MPTFVLRVILLRRCLCRARLRPSATLPSLATTVYTSTLAAFLGLGPGSGQPFVCCFVLLCSAVSACLSGITTLFPPCVVRCWTAGETMPSLAVAAATRFCVTTPSVMWCAPLCLSSLRSLLRLSGLLGISRSHLCSHLPPLCGFSNGCGCFPRGRGSQVCLPGHRLNVGPPLSRSSWRLAERRGRGEERGGGLVPGFSVRVTHCTRSFHRFASRHTSLRIAQRISCTLHQENARAILRRCSGLVGDQVPSSGW